MIKIKQIRGFSITQENIYGVFVKYHFISIDRVCLMKTFTCEISCQYLQDCVLIILKSYKLISKAFRWHRVNVCR